MTRRPINSAVEPHGRTAAGSLDQNDSVATNGPEIGARAAASSPDSTSQVSDRLAVLAELILATDVVGYSRLMEQARNEQFFTAQSLADLHCQRIAAS